MSIKVDHVSYVYDPDQKVRRYAIQDVSLEIRKGEFVSIIGHTGSGKSTLVQFLNGLLKPTEGHVYFEGRDIFEKDFSLKLLRQKVGIVFQYPDHQLFESDVLKDVMFGPKNMGQSPKEAEANARAALKVMAMDESTFEKSPFELSGGQKRRVAIAGILAMNPDYLILDEPTAGLDPEGRDEILELIRTLNWSQRIAVILVSHSMEDVAEYANRILVMNDGRIIMDDTPKNVFRSYRELEKIGLSAPQVTYVAHELKKKGFPIDEDIMTVEEAKKEILRILTHDS